MQPTLITCKNCGHHFKGNYCNHCGEKLYTDHDKAVTHFFDEAFHFVSHFDGSFFTTVKTIFSKPGRLSADYCNGRRKPYFKPLSFFLVLVVLYLLFPLFEGLNMQLQYYSQNAVYGGYVRQKVMSVSTEHHFTQPQLAELFHQKAEKVSKFLLVVIIPLTAVFFWMFTYKKRSYFFDQMIFAAEVNSVYLLWGFLLLPFLIFCIQGLYHFFSHASLSLADGVSGLLINIPLCVFVAIAARRFYSLTRFQAIALTIVFALAHEIIIHLMYKFLLFIIVINQIH